MILSSLFQFTLLQTRPLRADPAQPAAKEVFCIGLHVVASAPDFDQQSVPLDGRLSLEIGDGGCEGGGGPVDVALFLDADDTEVEHWRFEEAEIAVARGVLSVTPAELLLPDTGYRLFVNGGIRTVDIPFRTGDDGAVGMTEAPLWGDLSAGWKKCTGEILVEWSASPGADPDRLSVLEVRSEGEVLGRALAATGGGELLAATGDGEEPEEVCLELVQVDALGAEHSAGERCVVPEKTPCGVFEGCSTAPGRAGWLWAGALALPLLRRRSADRAGRA